MQKKTLYFQPLAVFAVSLCCYLLVHYTIFAETTGFNKYLLFASQYSRGVAAPERIIDFSPLYLYINAFLQKLFNDPGPVLLWIQFAVSALSSALFFVILRRFFTTTVSITGTVFFLLNRSVLLYSGINEPEIFLTLFILCFVFCTFRESSLMAAVSGLFLAFCLMIRLNLLPLVLITPIIYRFIHNKNGFVRKCILFSVPVIIAIIGLSIRNYSTIGTFSPVVMNPGTVFFEGNNPVANGRTVVYPPMVDNCIDELQNESDPAHALYRIIPRRITGKNLSIAQVNAYWSNKAKNFIIDHPFIWIRQLIIKIYGFFHNSRWHDIETVIANDLLLQKSFLPTIPFALISVLSLIGISISFGNWRKLIVLYGVFVSQIAVMVLTYSSDRQRVSVIFIFIFFACAAIDFLIKKSTNPSVKITTVIIAFFLLPFFYAKNESMMDGLYQRKQFSLAQGIINETIDSRARGNLQAASNNNILSYLHIPYLVESRLSGLRFPPDGFGMQAVAAAKRIYSENPSPGSQLDLLTIYLEHDNTGPAKVLVNDLIKKDRRFCRNSSQSSQPYFYAACIQEKNGNPDSVLYYLKRALSRNPGDPWILSHLAVHTGEQIYKERIARYFNEIDAAYFIGQASLANKKFEAAVQNFSYVTTIMPEYRDGFIYYAFALSGLQRYSEAAQSYIRAMQIRTEPIFKEKESIGIFRGWVAQEPENVQAKRFLASILADFGYYDESIIELGELKAQFPDEKYYENRILQLMEFKKRYGY